MAKRHQKVHFSNFLVIIMKKTLAFDDEDVKLFDEARVKMRHARSDMDVIRTALVYYLENGGRILAPDQVKSERKEKEPKKREVPPAIIETAKAIIAQNGLCPVHPDRPVSMCYCAENGLIVNRLLQAKGHPFNPYTRPEIPDRKPEDPDWQPLEERTIVLEPQTYE